MVEDRPVRAGRCRGARVVVLEDVNLRTVHARIRVRSPVQPERRPPAAVLRELHLRLEKPIPERLRRPDAAGGEVCRTGDEVALYREMPLAVERNFLLRTLGPRCEPPLGHVELRPLEVILEHLLPAGLHRIKLPFWRNERNGDGCGFGRHGFADEQIVDDERRILNFHVHVEAVHKLLAKEARVAERLAYAAVRQTRRENGESAVPARMQHDVGRKGRGGQFKAARLSSAVAYLTHKHLVGRGEARRERACRRGAAELRRIPDQRIEPEAEREVAAFVLRCVEMTLGKTERQRTGCGVPGLHRVFEKTVRYRSPEDFGGAVPLCGGIFVVIGEEGLLHLESHGLILAQGRSGYALYE